MNSQSSLPWCVVHTVMGYKIGMVNTDMQRRIAHTILKRSLEFFSGYEQLLLQVSTFVCSLLLIPPFPWRSQYAQIEIEWSDNKAYPAKTCCCKSTSYTYL